MEQMDWKIELIAVPVTDIDRARDFYANLGWNVDHDQTVSEEIRFVQITPPGSACSIALGKGVSDMEPGSMNADPASRHGRRWRPGAADRARRRRRGRAGSGLGPASCSSPIRTATPTLCSSCRSGRSRVVRRDALTRGPGARPARAGTCSAPRRNGRAGTRRAGPAPVRSAPRSMHASSTTTCADSTGTPLVMVQACRSCTSTTPGTSAMCCRTSSRSTPAGRGLEQHVDHVAQQRPGPRHDRARRSPGRRARRSGSSRSA